MFLFFFIGLMLIVLFFVRSKYERTSLSLERIVVESEKIKMKKTIAFLSDLHNNQFGKRNEKLIYAINQVNPDAILIGGDMMVCKGEKGVEIPLVLIEQLVKKYPIYYGNGNHENRMKRQVDIYGDQYEIYKKALKEMGVIYLEDEVIELWDDIRIGGIDLDRRYYKKFTKAKISKEELEEKLGKSEKHFFQILLAHSPMGFFAYREWGADLVLSGHFHGGTIRLPLLGGVMTPQFQFFFPWCAGFFEDGGHYLLVSRGLGTHSINIRFNNKPQLVVVELNKKSIF